MIAAFFVRRFIDFGQRHDRRFQCCFSHPNLFRRLFAEGAFSQAFVPVAPAGAARRQA
jgi:hypothetical protein